MAAKKLAQYSSSQKSKMFEQFKTMLKTIRPLLEEKYGVEEKSMFQQHALTDFHDRIVPNIPFIGGRANPYTTYLEQTAMALALYHTVQEWGGGLEQAGELIYKGMLLVASKYPKPLLHIYGMWANSKFQYPRMRREARISQRREYAADWVYDFIEGEGQEFDYGIDMHECGILKFLTDQGAEELLPYLCAVDYITYHAMGIELQRNETLAVGCARCNFRFIVSGNPLNPSWPPVFPERENRPSIPD
ncbi:MAG: L-2-amino-thiazoline-4-carboxylic acid hydrolase [Chloroflexi bacterium]|nr:L-2-amino-thiazoline-4-carboxylic acid hydrolase [Chloroflexota bacterium]